jgi:hypothetical protein
MANVLVAPFIPLSMGSGAIAFVLDFLSGWLGVMFEWFSMIFVGITWIFLEIIIQLTLFCSKIPLASVEVGDFDIFLVCLSYFFVWEVFKD